MQDGGGLQVPQEIEQVPLNHSISNNSLASTLPSDVLFEILIAYRDLFGEGQRNWLAVTQICWHWRLTALDCATLWSEIKFEGSLAFVQLMISRSRASPVSVEVPFHETMGEAMQKSWQALLESVVERLRKLKLFSLDGEQVEFFSRLIPRCGCLKTIAMSGWHNGGFDRGSPGSPWMVLTTRALDVLGSAPMLKHLVIDRRLIRGEWKVLGPMSSNLTSLTLVGVSWRNSARWEALYDYLPHLAQLAHLRHLTLHCILPQGHSRNARRVIMLRTLRSFNLMDTADSMAMMVSSVRIPATAVATFHLREVDSDVKQLLQALADCWLDANDRRRTLSEIQVHAKYSSEDPSKNGYWLHLIFISSVSPTSEIRLRLPSPAADAIRDLITLISEHFKLLNLRKLILNNIQAPLQFCEATWEAWLRCLPGLIELHLLRTDPGPLLSLLKRTDANGGRYFVPSLAYLALRGSMYKTPPLSDLVEKLGQEMKNRKSRRTVGSRSKTLKKGRV